MSDFEFDCMKKKQLAGQAKYRKRGSKKCTLPSDGMTNKQWKERCGSVVIFNFNKPMKWEDFKKLPTIVQTEYLTNLQKKFGTTAVDFGDMFGVQPLTVRRHVDANNLHVSFPRGRAMSRAQRAEWAKFIDATDKVSTTEASGSVGSADTTDDELCACDYTNCVESKNSDSTENTPVTPVAMSMKKFSLQFAGTIDIKMIANSLQLILGDKAEGELEIICNLT